MAVEEEDEAAAGDATADIAAVFGPGLDTLAGLAGNGGAFDAVPTYSGASGFLSALVAMFLARALSTTISSASTCRNGVLLTGSDTLADATRPGVDTIGLAD